MTTADLDSLICSKGGLTAAVRAYNRRLAQGDEWGSPMRLEAYERGLTPRQVAIERRNALVERLTEVNALIAARTP